MPSAGTLTGAGCWQASRYDIEAAPTEIVEQGGILDIADVEHRALMPIAGDVDHRRREVDAHAFARRKRDQQVAGPAAQLENALARPGQEAEIARVLGVKIFVAGVQVVDPGSEALRRLPKRLHT